MLKKIWDWLVLSSADPSKTSLTVKGILTGAVTFATIALGFAHVQLPTDSLTSIADGTITVVQDGLMLLSAVLALWGAVRKVYTTVVGTNKVVNNVP